MHTRMTGRLARIALAWLAGSLWLAGAGAQTVMPETELQQQARRWLDQSVASVATAATTPLRMEIEVGRLDSRLRLAPCSRIEHYLPVGTRLWGKTRIGLRCVDGASRWNVFLPVTVKARGPAWVLRRDLASGAVLGESDLIQSEVDWAEDYSPVIASARDWLGQTALRPLSTGQTLRQNMVRPSQVFQAGTMVRVVAQGAGFQITADGQALSPGVVGQLARVRMDNGRIMSGLVLDGKTVRLEM